MFRPTFLALAALAAVGVTISTATVAHDEHHVVSAECTTYSGNPSEWRQGTAFSVGDELQSYPFYPSEPPPVRVYHWGPVDVKHRHPTLWSISRSIACPYTRHVIPLMGEDGTESWFAEVTLGWTGRRPFHKSSFTTGSVDEDGAVLVYGYRISKMEFWYADWKPPATGSRTGMQGLRVNPGWFPTLVRTVPSWWPHRVQYAAGT